MEQSVINENNSIDSEPRYVALQVKFSEAASHSAVSRLTELEEVINTQAQKGYRLHTISTESSEITGRRSYVKTIATVIFEKIS